MKNRFTSNALPGESRLGDEAADCLGYTRGSLAFQQTSHVGTSHQHEVVPARYLGVQRPKSLSQRALHRVSLYGAAHLAAHGDPESSVVLSGLPVASRERVENEESIGVRPALTVDTVEVAAA